MRSQVAERDENRDTHTHTHSMISKRSANRMQTERKKPTFGPSWLQTKRIQIQVEIEESRASWKDSHIYHHHIAPYVSMVMGRESKVHKHCANWTQQTYQHPSYHQDQDQGHHHHHHHHHWYYCTRIQIMCCILRGDNPDRTYLRCCSHLALIRLHCLEGVRERWQLCSVTFTGFRC